MEPDLPFLIVTIIYVVIVLIFAVALFFPDKKLSSGKPFVSVVIAARNEEENIGDLLSDLSNQTYPKDKYEVIVANDRSEDRTGEIIDSYARNHTNFLHVKVQPDDKIGLIAKKNALNQGIQRSRGEIILSTDADCRVKSTWIETMVSFFTPETGMVVGFSQLGQKGEKRSLFEKIQAVDFLALMGAAQGSINLGIPLAASGQNLGFRRQAFLEVGGYEKIKDRISGDDVLLLQLIYKFTNWKSRFAHSDAAFNWTQPMKTLSDFLNQRKRWASNGLIQLRLNKIFFVLLWVMLIVNGVFFIGIPYYLVMGMPLLLPLICILVKISVEFLMVLAAGLRYQRLDLVKYFPFWMIAQIPYVAVTGVLGFFGKFNWKNRPHKQGLTNFRIDK